MLEGDLLGLEGEPVLSDHEAIPDPKNQKMLNLLQENFDFAQRSRVRCVCTMHGSWVNKHLKAPDTLGIKQCNCPCDPFSKAKWIIG